MKKNIYITICLALIILIIVPVINITSSHVQKKTGKKYWSKSSLYSLDFALPYIGRAFYVVGISIDPDKAIIGYNGWLYLGDSYAKTITTKRHESTNEDEILAKKIALSSKSREHWLKLKGVKQYRVIVGANKDSIYPEFLPHWAKQVANSPIDTLFANVSHKIYIDTRSSLKAARNEFQQKLYYKTDTHWNALGGLVAFRAFAKNLATAEPSLIWPNFAAIKISATKKCGGDLANFLRIPTILSDEEINIKFTAPQPITTQRYDFKTKKLITPEDGHKTELVVSKNALNKKRVLWLKDSFGGAMSQYMEATFSDILQIHYSEMKNGKYAQLVNEFKPDYVFVTVVERNARNEHRVENPS